MMRSTSQNGNDSVHILGSTRTHKCNQASRIFCNAGNLVPMLAYCDYPLRKKLHNTNMHCGTHCSNAAEALLSRSRGVNETT